MKKNLISGFILLLPLAITLIVFGFLINFLTKPFLDNVQHFLLFFTNAFSINADSHQTLLLILSRIIILILLFLFVTLLGFLGQKIFFNWIVKGTNALLLKIPLINSVYKISKDIINTILSDNKKIFSRVVMIPFPANATGRAIALVSGNAPKEAQDKFPAKEEGEVLKTLFVPTSPHPISGFVLLVRERNIENIDLIVEDAFKYLISCGIFTPKKESKKSS